MEYCDDCGLRLMEQGMPNILSEIKHYGTCEICGEERVKLQGRNSSEAHLLQYDYEPEYSREWSAAERDKRARLCAVKQIEKAARRSWNEPKKPKPVVEEHANVKTVTFR
jgi:hypothetical protein